MWRTTPWHRLEEHGSWSEDAPPALPDGVTNDEIQDVGDGAGPFFHRRYHARIRDSEIGPEELIERLGANPNKAAPSAFAIFRKALGE